MKQIFKNDGLVFLLLVSAMLLLIVVSAGKQQNSYMKQQDVNDTVTENLFLLHA